jgi:hypothetical protein
MDDPKPEPKPLSYAKDERQPWFIMHVGGWIVLAAILVWSIWQLLRHL